MCLYLMYKIVFFCRIIYSYSNIKTSENSLIQTKMSIIKNDECYAK